MKLRYTGLNLPLDHQEADIKRALSKKIGVVEANILTLEVFRRSIDARKSPVIFSYTVDFTVVGDATKLAASKKLPLTPNYEFKPIMLPIKNDQPRPVVVGFGPAGIFAAYYLAMAGQKPIVIERGQSVEERKVAVDLFWQKGILDENSNVQFGEGGAGAFSDGKLTTRIKDPLARYISELLVKHGAPAAILIDQKPHVGTDLLVDVVKSMRDQIIAWGGELRFNTVAKGFERGANGEIKSISLADLKTNQNYTLDVSTAFLAIGHSARDTYKVLFESGIQMASKPFAMGLRIEHPKAMIDSCQYGSQAGHPKLGAADYSVKANVDGRSVYSFCMCPGGYVINASTEPGRLVVNGMSYHARNAENSNSALLVSLGVEDYSTYALHDNDPLAGLRMQELLETNAFMSVHQSDIQEKSDGVGVPFSAPVQLVGDFLKGHISTQLGQVMPSIEPAWHFVNFDNLLPDFMADALRRALPQLGKQIQGFDREDAILTGIETRSSSPVRLVRGDGYESVNTPGLYPIGEGAGYAGGITSAAVDGIASVHQWLTDCTLI